MRHIQACNWMRWRDDGMGRGQGGVGQVWAGRVGLEAGWAMQGEVGEPFALPTCGAHLSLVVLSGKNRSNHWNGDDKCHPPLPSFLRRKPSLNSAAVTDVARATPPSTPPAHGVGRVGNSRCAAASPSPRGGTVEASACEVAPPPAPPPGGVDPAAAPRRTPTASVWASQRCGGVPR
eukprot:gene1247-biopygen13823